MNLGVFLDRQKLLRRNVTLLVNVWETLSLSWAGKRAAGQRDASLVSSVCVGGMSIWFWFCQGFLWCWESETVGDGRRPDCFFSSCVCLNNLNTYLTGKKKKKVFTKRHLVKSVHGRRIAAAFCGWEPRQRHSSCSGLSGPFMLTLMVIEGGWSGLQAQNSSLCFI